MRGGLIEKFSCRKSNVKGRFKEEKVEAIQETKADLRSAEKETKGRYLKKERVQVVCIRLMAEGSRHDLCQNFYPTRGF